MNTFNQKKIEQYLRGQLSPLESKQLEQKLKEDQNFLDEFKAYELIFITAKKAQHHAQHEKLDNLKNSLNNIQIELKEDGFFTRKDDSKNKTTQKINYLWLITGITSAACVISFIIISLFFSNSSTTPLFVETPEVKIQANAFALKGTKLLEEGLQAYEQENFEYAIQKLNAYLQKKDVPIPTYKQEASFYLAISLGKVNKIEQSKSYLIHLSQQPNFSLHADVSWYLAEIHEVQNNIPAAKEIWQSLLNEKNYGSKAKAKLENFNTKK